MWSNMDVAVKIMLFQNTAALDRVLDVALEKALEKARQLVLREAAVCCSMSHPNVVATYHFEVLQASTFHDTPTGLRIMDKSGEKAFKLYLVQVGTGWVASRVCVLVCPPPCVPPRWVLGGQGA